MSDTYQPRRPLVPGPEPAQQSIAQRAIELRDRAREQQLDKVQSPAVAGLGGAPTAPPVRPPGPVGKIAEAVSNIMANVGTIKKGGYNSFHRYRYARMEDLLQVLTPLMGQNGLAVIQTEVEIQKVEGNRVAVVYEFSIFHKSGEVWPTPARHTGTSIARDSKGNWDDKAIAKCHTQARKYFLLSLFQVPAGDFDDNDDGDDANQRQERGPVPGPKQTEEKTTSREAASTVEVPTGPHKIALGSGAGPDQWAGAYIKAIEQAKTVDEVKQWDALNDQTLQAISDRYSKVYERIDMAVQQRLQQLGAPDIMPDPKADSQAAMNWVASELAQINHLAKAAAFWNEKVGPRESEFDAVDWGMLVSEWVRTKERLTTPA